MTNPQEAQQKAPPAAYPRLPWWSVAGRSVIMLGIGVAAEIDSTGRSVVFATLSLAWIVLEELTERHIGLAALRTRRNALSNIVRVAPVIVWLLILVLGSSALRNADAPAPVLITAATLAAIMALLAQPLHKAFHASLRHDA